MTSRCPTRVTRLHAAHRQKRLHTVTRVTLDSSLSQLLAPHCAPLQAKRTPLHAEGNPFHGFCRDGFRFLLPFCSIAAPAHRTPSDASIPSAPHRPNPCLPDREASCVHAHAGHTARHSVAAFCNGPAVITGCALAHRAVATRRSATDGDPGLVLVARAWTMHVASWSRRRQGMAAAHRQPGIAAGFSVHRYLTDTMRLSTTAAVRD